jgi:hypothetical protein
MHQQIVQSALAALDRDRAKYFADVMPLLEMDSRTQAEPNLIYAVLKETMHLIPPYLPRAEFVDLLHTYVHQNRDALNFVLYSAAYVTNSQVLAETAMPFVQDVVSKTFDLHEDGTIETGEPSVRRYGWPYENVDFPYAD